MTGNLLNNKTKVAAPLAILVTLGLAGCDETGAFQMPTFGAQEPASQSDAAPAAPSGVMVERDVEAPEVFSVAENGLWDGRPSLGGVWVAHPDVTDPERVIIRNDANGKSVIGALFRRERDNPGPALQVSSDAAEELGVLAGAPTALNVVALRREEGPATPPPAAATVDFDNPVEITAAPLDDTVAVATAAIAAAEVAEAPAPAPAPVSSLEKPFIQIGIFSVEDNANRTAERLRGDGLSARILAQESQGRAFWRVIVGPAPNADDRAAVLAKVKALGFEDAYAVTN